MKNKDNYRLKMALHEEACGMWANSRVLVCGGLGNLNSK